MRISFFSFLIFFLTLSVSPSFAVVSKSNLNQTSTSETTVTFKEKKVSFWKKLKMAARIDLSDPVYGWLWWAGLLLGAGIIMMLLVGSSGALTIIPNLLFLGAFVSLVVFILKLSGTM
jgi:hypothetical protein